MLRPNPEKTKSGNLKSPSPRLICEWIKQAWEELPAEIIVKSFLKAGISNKLDGSEDHWIFETPAASVEGGESVEGKDEIVDFTSSTNNEAKADADADSDDGDLFLWFAHLFAQLFVLCHLRPRYLTCFVQQPGRFGRRRQRRRLDAC